jgi:tRNA-dihydrouridine synthase B
MKALKPKSLFLAPMEGITDETFRKTILSLYPEWDYLACDFLRVPSAGRYPRKHLIKHLGKELFYNESVKQNTLFQILTSEKAYTKEMVDDLEDLKIPWVDLNLGCPSNTVCKNGGGSFLLQNLKAIENIISIIRKNFSGRFSVKIRTGFDHTNDFENIIKLLNDGGADMITVHGRTRTQMYKEPADWEFISKAVKISRVPIIGNGDIWCPEDIDRMINETGCFGVMMGRGALETPWIAKNYKSNKFVETDLEKYSNIKSFFKTYRENLLNEGISERGLLKQSKSVSRYMLSKTKDGEQLRRKLILSQTSNEFFQILDNI